MLTPSDRVKESITAFAAVVNRAGVKNVACLAAVKTVMTWLDTVRKLALSGLLDDEHAGLFEEAMQKLTLAVQIATFPSVKGTEFVC